MSPGAKIILNKPLSWKNANADALVLLQSLQGNILKGHGRHFTANLFFRLKPGNDRASRRMLRDLANFHVTSAYRQLLDADHYKRSGKKRKGGKGAGPFVHVALSAKGYDAIGRTRAAPKDAEFSRGMRHQGSVADLADPQVADWEPPFREEIHGIVIAAHETAAETGALAAVIRELIEDAKGTIFVQHGAALFNAAGEGIEHFGYVDGRSLPLLLEEDIAEERETAGTSRWDPAAGLDIALVEDPGVPVVGSETRTAYGSYLIFRKLEQHVLAFKTREQEVADILKLKGDARELAGAMIVGRFEDGTPVTLSDKARALKPPNNFNYAGDDGIRCPLHAHIRKTNPRGSGGFEEPDKERLHLMPRRGIPYEDTRREVPPAELPDAGSMKEFKDKVADKLPEDGVGLLFMAYNSKIGQQFKFTQKKWANERLFPKNPADPPDGQPIPAGIDPVIGQGSLTPDDQKLPCVWDEPSKGTSDKVDFSGFVHMKGGEYFFSPSLTFLLNL